MDTPSRTNNALSRMALGALDVNAHLNSPFKSPTTKYTSNSHDDAACKNAAYQPEPQLSKMSSSNAASPRPPSRSAQDATRTTLPYELPPSSQATSKRKATDTTSDYPSTSKFSRFSPSQAYKTSFSHSRSHSEHSAPGHGHRQSQPPLFGEIPRSPTPSRRPLSEGVAAEDSQETISFTSSTSTSSQAAAVEENTQSTTLTIPSPSNPTRRRAQTMSNMDILEAKERLKARLRIAMFKVQTGQTGVPFEELEVRGVSRRFPDVVPSPERGRWSAPSIARTIEGRGAPAARDGLLDLLGAAERR